MTEMARPKSTKPLLTPTERVQKSFAALEAAGGKRITLRLSPQGYDALKTIMKLDEIPTETAAINETLTRRSRYLLNRK